MSTNENSVPPPRVASPWRRRFRIACLLSLGFAVSLMLISRAIPRGNAHEAPPLLLILDGLLGLAELLSWVAAVLCGIGWALILAADPQVTKHSRGALWS